MAYVNGETILELREKFKALVVAEVTRQLDERFDALADSVIELHLLPEGIVHLVAQQITVKSDLRVD